MQAAFPLRFKERAECELETYCETTLATLILTQMGEFPPMLRVPLTLRVTRMLRAPHVTH